MYYWHFYYWHETDVFAQAANVCCCALFDLALVLRDVCLWQILLQKSVVTDDVRSPSSFRAMGFVPDPDAPTQLLRYAIHRA
jgi:hypothetical protein